jgi:hypothetical protein
MRTIRSIAIEDGVVQPRPPGVTITPVTAERLRELAEDYVERHGAPEPYLDAVEALRRALGEVGAEVN